jgi:hypothetical protein
MSNNRFDAMEETYRNEGLSVGSDHMVRNATHCLHS